MCGIVAYIGKNEAYPVVIKGLKRLEYRGYDSSGVALITSSWSTQCLQTRRQSSESSGFCGRTRQRRTRRNWSYSLGYTRRAF